ncbi:MAG: methionine aminotransferase [Bacteroidota bacterium]|nr:methionine aminotransferase [Bacteroidota bacterium]
MPQFPNIIKSKLPKAGTSIFAVMSALANKHNAINLAQGFPDFACDPELVKLVNDAMKKGHNQYAPMPGHIPLREAIAEKTSELYSAYYNPDTEITIMPGGTLAINATIMALVHEGDEVIVIEPCYDSYVPSIIMAGGIPVYASMKMPGYQIDWSELKKLVNHHTRMIILNTPNNPTGQVISSNDMQKLQKLVEGTDIIILSDEVYEHIIFDGYEHQSVSRFPKLAERSVIISSFGKTFHTTGWKIGYCLAPANLMVEIRKAYQFMVFSVHTPTQYAITEYIKNKDTYLQLGAFYQQKRDYFANLMEGSQFKLLPCSGSYFQCAVYDKISNENDKEFANRVTIEAGVASIPISAFYHKGVDNKVLRFCFAKKEETLEKAAEKLSNL